MPKAVVCCLRPTPSNMLIINVQDSTQVAPPTSNWPRENVRNNIGCMSTEQGSMCSKRPDLYVADLKAAHVATYPNASTSFRPSGTCFLACTHGHTNTA
eukprot:1151695-Pelagomonas_calceolata.AAC.7